MITSLGWDGIRRSGVALAMRHRHSRLSTYGLNGLRKGDEHPVYAPSEYGPFLPYEPDYALAADVVSPLSVPWSYLGHPVKCYKQSPAISAVITEPLPRGVGAVGRTPALKGPPFRRLFER